MIKTHAFLAIEAGLTQRLQKSWDRLAWVYFSQVDDAIRKGDYALATQIANSIDLAPIHKQNEEYIRYSMYSALLFGASRLNKDVGATTIARGEFDNRIRKVELLFERTMKLNVERHLRKSLLRYVDKSFVQNPTTPTGPREVRKDDIGEADLDVAGRLNPEQGEAPPKKKKKLWKFWQWLSKDDGDDPDLEQTDPKRRKLKPKVKPVPGQSDTGVTTTWTIEKGFGPMLGMEVYGPLQPSNGFPTAPRWFPQEPSPPLAMRPENNPKATFAHLLSKDGDTELGSGSKKKPVVPKVPEPGNGLMITAKDEQTSGVDSTIIAPRGLTEVADEGDGGFDDGKKKKTRLAINEYGSIIEKSGFAQMFKAEEYEVPEERLAQPFVSFKNGGDGLLEMVSSLHSSRLSAFGFTAEAEALGITRYEITEMLDSRTCDVCEEMDGRSFEVKHARASLDALLDTQDPNDLATMQPWPDQEDAGDLADMSEDDIVRNNWHIPPFHPGCRGLLTKSEEEGEAAPQPDQADAASRLQDVMSVDGFSEFGIDMEDYEVDDWNRAVKTDVGDVLAGFLGEQPTALMDRVGEDGSYKDMGLSVFRMLGDEGFVLKASTEMFGSEEPVDALMKFYTSKGEAWMDDVEIAAADQGKGIAKKLLTSWDGLWDRLGIDEVKTYAGMDMGGYAWAKYGFVPEQAAWDDLRVAVKEEELSDLKGKISDESMMVLKAALDDTDPKAIWTIADLTEEVDGQTLGKKMLAGREWMGSLDRTDDEAITRFGQYVES